jgi:hypothetical protein
MGSYDYSNRVTWASEAPVEREVDEETATRPRTSFARQPRAGHRHIRRRKVVGQLYLQRFVNREGAAKTEIDRAWGDAFKTFARSGNWGGVDKGVTHRGTYGTGWGGYILLEVDDPEAFGRYQAYHYQTYGAAVHITFEPLWDMDSAFAETIRNSR